MPKLSCQACQDDKQGTRRDSEPTMRTRTTNEDHSSTFCTKASKTYRKKNKKTGWLTYNLKWIFSHSMHISYNDTLTLIDSGVHLFFWDWNWNRRGVENVLTETKQLLVGQTAATLPTFLCPITSMPHGTLTTLITWAAFTPEHKYFNISSVWWLASIVTLTIEHLANWQWVYFDSIMCYLPRIANSHLEIHIWQPCFLK